MAQRSLPTASLGHVTTDVTDDGHRAMLIISGNVAMRVSGHETESAALFALVDQLTAITNAVEKMADKQALQDERKS